MRHGLWAVALGVFLWTAPGRAADQYPRVALEVKRGEGTDDCVEADELSRAVDARLRREAFTPKDPELHLQVTLEKRQPRGFLAVVVLEDAKGTEVGHRELGTNDEKCSSLDDSLALVAALLVDSPEAQQQANAQRPPAAPAPKPRKPAPSGLPGSQGNKAPPRDNYRVDVAAALEVSVGELPGVALGGALLVAVRPPRFVELRVKGAVFPAHGAAGPRPGQGGQFSLLAAALELCPLERELAAIRLSGCLGPSIGRVRSAGFGFTRDAQADALVASLGLGASALYRLTSPLFVLAGLNISASMVRTTYIARALDGSTAQVFRTGVLAGGAFGGLGIEL